MDHMDELLVIGRIGHLKDQVHPLLEQLMLPRHSRIFVFGATTRKASVSMWWRYHVDIRTTKEVI